MVFSNTICPCLYPAEQARFFRASAHIVKSLAAILNFSGSGRLERERKIYRVGERKARGRIGGGVGRRKWRSDMEVASKVAAANSPK